MKRKKKLEGSREMKQYRETRCYLKLLVTAFFLFIVASKSFSVCFFCFIVLIFFISLFILISIIFLNDF